MCPTAHSRSMLCARELSSRRAVATASPSVRRSSGLRLDTSIPSADASSPACTRYRSAVRPHRGPAGRHRTASRRPSSRTTARWPGTGPSTPPRPLLPRSSCPSPIIHRPFGGCPRAGNAWLVSGSVVRSSESELPQDRCGAGRQEHDHDERQPSRAATIPTATPTTRATLSNSPPGSRVAVAASAARSATVGRVSHVRVRSDRSIRLASTGPARRSAGAAGEEQNRNERHWVLLSVGEVSGGSRASAEPSAVAGRRDGRSAAGSASRASSTGRPAGTSGVVASATTTATRATRRGRCCRRKAIAAPPALPGRRRPALRRAGLRRHARRAHRRSPRRSRRRTATDRWSSTPTGVVAGRTGPA